MFGIGISEILVLLVVLALTVIPLVIVILVVMYLLRSQKGGASGDSNLRGCPDCGGVVSQLAASCPHCGRPMSV